ncbi:MAG: flagellar hook capping FlgD N-terminal domain-containing protein, partial [Limisphaerales bacterium]
MSATATTASSSSSNSTLNQADFLQLLVTQMTSQDP